MAHPWALLTLPVLLAGCGVAETGAAAGAAAESATQLAAQSRAAEQQVRGSIGEPVDHMILGGDPPGPVPRNGVAQELTAPVFVVPEVHAQHLQRAWCQAGAGE